MTIQAQALAYHANGYNLLPIGPDKRPTIKSWKQWQTEQQSDELILEWFKDNKNNIGIITGKISGITVVDIDNKDGQDKADQIYAKFPPTFAVRTPSGGYHCYYKYAEGFTVSANAYPNLPNVDIRSDSGYVGAPPSINANSKAYEVINNIPLSTFPTALFPKIKPKKTLTEQTTASKGQRNDTITSFTGRLLQSSKEDEWESEVWPAVQRTNMTYTPPLAQEELRTVFSSIVKKEKQRRAELIISPIQLEDGQEIPATAIKLRKNGNAIIKDMTNVFIVLESHPYYKGNIKFNSFRQEIEYNSKPLEDSDINKIQYFMQLNAGLASISKEAVYSAIVHCAQQHSYDEAKDWLTSLVWDGTPRLHNWVSMSLGVQNDKYHQGIGSQWLRGMVSRIMHPGAQFDYVFMLVGPQNLGKTSFFRIIGGNFYKSYTGGIDNKDFYLATRGAILMDLDEGATLYKSEAIKIKSIISEVVDEYRAPYDRIMKKYPRRFVFSLSTNDPEPFRDVTGNRRYWAVDITQNVNFKWLEENRDQLFAESYYYFKNNIDIAEVPMEEAMAIQEAHLPDDSWTELVCNEIRVSAEYCAGDPNYSITILDVFSKIFKDESLVRLDRRHEMRIGNIFRKQLGLEKRRQMIDGEQKNRWYISEKKIKQLQLQNATKTVTPLEELAEDMKEDKQEEIPF